MAKGEGSVSMASQSKKKQNEDDPMQDDVSGKPLQLQRRRVWRACESCRRKKIKCDGCEPTCSQCSMSGSQCTWLQTKDRAALSRHYVQELEARLLHMESLFQKIAPVIEQQVAASSSGDAPPSLDPETLAPAQAILRQIVPQGQGSESSITPPPPEKKAEEEVSELFGQLALDEYGHMRWIGGSSTMSLIQSFKALTTSPLHRISPMEEDPQAPGPSVNKLYFPAAVYFGKIHALPGPEEVEFPERDLADKLVEAYFSRLHFLMPVIDKPSFLRKYSQLMDNNQSQEVVRSETAFMSLLFALFACAANLVEDPRLAISERHDDGGMGMVYYERALVLQYISHPNIQPSHVQCFILMSSFLCSVNCLPQAWILIGQAVRAGQDLGLHRSPRRLVITPVEKETRRKIWWGVYTLDRMLAIALGRPLGVNDADCDVELPVDVDDEHLPEYFSGATMNQKQQSLMTGNIALIKLYEIGGRILRQVYALENCKDHLEPERKATLQQTVESLDNELTKWCDELPAAFKSQSETEDQVSMGAVLCSHYYSMLTTLHRNLLPVKRDQPVITPKSTVKAVSSARSCIRLAPSMKHVVPASHHLAFFIQHLFSSAVIVLLYAMHASDPRAAAAAMDEAKSTLEALQSWEGHWPGAKKCKDLLIDLVTTATEAIAQAKAAPPVATPASPTSSNHERRRSVTILNPVSTAASGSRVAKGRTRRTQSRDPGTGTSRRLAAVSPYRTDGGQRARSASRKRGHDDGDVSAGPFYQSFTSPTLAHGASSSHSSPASANLPSPGPPPSTDNSQATDPSPRLATSTVPSNGSGNYHFASPLSPAQLPSPHRYEFEYGVPPSALSQSSQQWNGSNGNNGNDQHMFNHQGSAEHPLYGFGVYTSALDAYPGYDAAGEFSPGLGAPMNGSPTSSYATSLPFRGLDYIKNYSQTGYSGDQDLWQSYDPGAFGYDPDLPFTIPEATHEIQDTAQRS
ncbi:fungal-specific transcription factor domain-containing protein [Crepidotus variabilis]|uniref:Fungal-specific transcription factor domain-containing protein n=1 Tax=Crepidotus variabilis TaxID=179855 RepID=A0A9P6ET06_9AGAR|nr:fungal-specific transcription factor domain-containing protein [Crepidotus variabilis]